MPATYEPIATTTLGSATSPITFSSIPATYTDLRVVLVCTTTSATQDVYMRFNADAGSNYSSTNLSGNGSTATSTRETSTTRIIVNKEAYTNTTIPEMYTIDIFSYAGSTNKTCLMTSSGDNNGSGAVDRNVGLWRSSSAINAIEFRLSAGSYNTGTTATLYGILKA